MTTKYLTAQNVQTITETFIDAAELDSTQETIGDLLKDLKERLAKHSITFDSDSRLEAVGGITELIENTCDEHKITIHNPDYDEAIEDGLDPAGLSKIYGALYFTLEDVILPMLEE
jgi:hypothetical protein